MRCDELLRLTSEGVGGSCDWVRIGVLILVKSDTINLGRKLYGYVLAYYYDILQVYPLFLLQRRGIFAQFKRFSYLLNFMNMCDARS